MENRPWCAGHLKLTSTRHFGGEEIFVVERAFLKMSTGATTRVMD
jgi:hypothetical protein